MKPPGYVPTPVEREESWWQIDGRDCYVTIERRPAYCDRGRFIAKVFPLPGTPLYLSFDSQDGWPRYYFDWDRMLAEIGAWMEVREQVPDDAVPDPTTATIPS
jgi:hypothetical protein